MSVYVTIALLLRLCVANTSHTLALLLQYDGNLVKLRACIASLCGTHEVVRKTPAGLLYLTAKGQRSVQLCPGSLSSASVQQPQPSTAPLETATTAPRPAQEPLRPADRQSSFSSVSTSEPELTAVASATVYMATSSTVSTTTRTSTSTSTTTRTSVVCIDVSDSDDHEDDDEDTGSYDYEPDEEPLLFVEPPKPREPSPLPSNSTAAALPLPPQTAATAPLSTTDASDDAALMLPTDEWELVLLLDHREILSRQNRNVMERKLLEHRVTCEVRALNVGDMQWIAKRYRSGSVSGTSRIDSRLYRALATLTDLHSLSRSCSFSDRVCLECDRRAQGSARLVWEHH